jgi:hypothetical protein
MERTPRGAQCDEFEDDLAVLAIGALTGHERSRVLGHLEGCPYCAAQLDELSEAADRLTTLVPEATPPAGFSGRTMAMVRAEPSAPHQPNVRRVAAVAVVAILLAIGGGVGALVSSSGHHPLPTAVRSAPLRSTQGATGTVLLVSSDQRAWLVMTLHDGPASGSVTCTLVLNDGTRRSVGVFSLAAGYGSWTAPLPVPPSSVRGVDVVDDRGTMVATARMS